MPALNPGNRESPKKAGFFWQGLLIVFPALLLAVVGLWSLREDRVLAQHDAVEAAKRIAADLARARLPLVLRAAFASGERSADDSILAPEQPGNDPIEGRARRKPSQIACLFEEPGGLVYPPNPSPSSSGRSIESGGLNATQTALWGDAEQFEFVREDYARAAEAYTRFLRGTTRGPLAALASYRLGMLMVKLGRETPARVQLESVVSRFPGETSPAGVPLSVYASIQLLRLTNGLPVPAARRLERVNSVGSRLVLGSPEMAGVILSGMSGLEGTIGGAAAEWRKVLAAHENARQLWRQYEESAHGPVEAGVTSALGAWVTLSGSRSWIAFPQSGGKRRWLAAISEPDMYKLVDDVLTAEPLPEYFKVGVAVAGRTLTAASGHPEELAVSTVRALFAETAPESSDGPDILRAGGAALPSGAAFPEKMSTATVAPRLAPPDLAVTVYLADPSALFARQRSRTLWFGALIVLSAGALLVGFATARRAFLRQRELGEMKTNFVSSVSHELRAPIASVRLMAEELCEAGPENPEKTRSYHAFIVQECRRLSALIENVLNFSRQEEGRERYEFEPTDLAALVESTVKLMRTYGAEKQIAVESEVRGEPVEIEADGRAVQQIMVNLIDNALKHSPPGAVVRVGLDFPAARSSGAQPAREGTVRLWVEDQGPGIPMEEQKRVFERFYRRGSELRRETQGVGLGLAIVKMAAEAHGGVVTVRSDAGKGCRFTVELPFQPPPQNIRRFAP